MPDDPVKVAPRIYKVLLENDHVRVLEARMRPGDKSPMHGHPQSVVYTVEDSRGKFTFPDGKSEPVDLKAGQVMWLDAHSHAVEAVAHVIIVELKESRRK